MSLVVLAKFRHTSMVIKRQVPSLPPSPQPERRRRATSYDVAERAGVSQSAVSRCFAPGTSIAPATRDKILKVAEELGYRPNALAQSLNAKQSQLVAVLISALGAVLYPKVLSEITRHLHDRNFRVLLFPLYDNADVADILDQAIRHNVDGVIAAAHLDPELLKRFHRHQVPLVLYNRVSFAPSLASVCCDTSVDAHVLVGKLLAAGLRNFGVITGPTDAYISEARFETTLQLLAKAGVKAPAIVRCDYVYEQARSALLELLTANPAIEAIICTSDIMAIGAIDAARDDLALDVPGQLSIAGFDGIDSALWSGYAVTTVAQPIESMAAAAVQLLVERIKDPTRAPERRLFEGRFIAGRSARLAPTITNG